MREGLSIGHRGQRSLAVGAAHSIHLGADRAAHPAGAVVFSTPQMINLMEHAARDALRPYLDPGEESVGATVAVEHLAATPVGANVRAVATVTAVDGRLIDFTIEAFDDTDQIGRGTHRRAVVRLDRIRERLREKTSNLPGGIVWPMNIDADTGPLPSLRTLDVRVDGAEALVTLNRPAALNAVDQEMTAEWERLIAWFAGHEEVRVVLLTGAGRAFCAGDDVKEVATLDRDAAEQLSLRQARLYLALERLPQVVIAVVNGAALGGGCVAAYSCDLRVASHHAVFGMPEVLLGWPPGYGVAQLTALVGKARALELCTTGRQITAQTALEWGLVNEVAAGNRLMTVARQWAARLLAAPPHALRETKRLIHADEGEAPKLAHLADTNAYVRCLATDDAREGIAAFVEKRPPNFTGR